MKQSINPGDKFGRWTVIKFNGLNNDNKRQFLCRCDCRSERSVRAYYLTSGSSRSCGCLSREMLSDRATHGKSQTREYRIWRAMKGRCLNPTHSSFVNYGHRGINVCQKWADSFEAFYFDMGPCPKNYTIERIDVNGDYELKNCKWASRLEQSRNTRPRTSSGINGVTKSGNSWRAQIMTGKGKRHLKSCKDFFEACCIRKSAELKYWEQQQ